MNYLVSVPTIPTFSVAVGLTSRLGRKTTQLYTVCSRICHGSSVASRRSDGVTWNESWHTVDTRRGSIFMTEREYGYSTCAVARFFRLLFHLIIDHQVCGSSAQGNT